MKSSGLRPKAAFIIIFFHFWTLCANVNWSIPLFPNSRIIFCWSITEFTYVLEYLALKLISKLFYWYDFKYWRSWKQKVNSFGWGSLGFLYGVWDTRFVVVSVIGIGGGAFTEPFRFTCTESSSKSISAHLTSICVGVLNSSSEDSASDVLRFWRFFICDLNGVYF